MKLKTFWANALALCIVFFSSCEKDNNIEPEKHYSAFTESFISMVNNNSELKSLLTESIELCRKQNPDKESNPVQSLSDYYDLVEWSIKCMPWEIFPQPAGRDLFNRIDQSLNYFYWLVDQDLYALKDKDYYHPSLQYHEPFRTWLVDYTKEWGHYLSTPDSWNADYLKIVKDNEKFGLGQGWYEDPSQWNSFNDFFARRLSSPSVRPISDPSDPSVVASPADSEPQGIWAIDSEGLMVQKEGVVIKSRRYRSTEELMANSQYRSDFKNGTMTHTFLNVHDYHRYHFPMSGKILEIIDIPGDEAIGGDVVYDDATKTYIIECEVPQWQAIETRQLVVLETEFGKVAVMPIGMSQICSCNWTPGLKVGDEVKKGDQMGYFLFGGSDIVLLFQSDVEVTMACPENKNGGFEHVLMGEKLCVLKHK